MPGTRTQPSDACLDDLGLRVGAPVYAQALESESALAAWRMEGPGKATFPLGRMRLESTGCAEDAYRANFVFWCPRRLPDYVRISWDFYPIREPGLAMLFFSATGRAGVHVLDESLAPRTGEYGQYHDGDIDTLHVSYFRRRNPKESQLHTANLRKSRGFHLVCQGGDPIPAMHQVQPPYRVAVIKAGPLVRFCIDHVVVFTWRDDGRRYGPVLTGGCIGFRQMHPLIAEYGDLLVEELLDDARPGARTPAGA